MSHEHHHDHSHSHEYLPETSSKLSGALRVIARLNKYSGNTQLIAGVLLQSATVTMGGVHDRVDHSLYKIKADAADALDEEVERKLRRKGAKKMMTFAGALFAAEAVHYAVNPQHEPSFYSIPVAAGAFALNSISAALLFPHRHNKRAKDGIRHALMTDVPSSAITLTCAALAQKNPAFDVIGAGFHTGVSVAIASKTMSETK